MKKSTFDSIDKALSCVDQVHRLLVQLGQPVAGQLMISLRDHLLSARLEPVDATPPPPVDFKVRAEPEGATIPGYEIARPQGVTPRPQKSKFGS